GVQGGGPGADGQAAFQRQEPNRKPARRAPRVPRVLKSPKLTRLLKFDREAFQPTEDGILRHRGHAVGIDFDAGLTAAIEADPGPRDAMLLAQPIFMLVS